MVFSRVKPGKYIRRRHILTAAELNQIDENQSLALDGTAGGYYLLNNDIILEGVNGIELQDNIRLKYEERSIELQYHHYTVYNYNDAHWAREEAYLEANITGNPISISIPYLPDGNILTSISVRLFPVVLGRGGLPGNMPWFEVYENYLDDSAYPTISWGSHVHGPFVDPSPDVAAYETDHYINGILDLPIKKNSRFDVTFTSEDGVNSFAASRIWGIKLAFLINQHSEI